MITITHVFREGAWEEIEAMLATYPKCNRCKIPMSTNATMCAYCTERVRQIRSER